MMQLLLLLALFGQVRADAAPKRPKAQDQGAAATRVRLPFGETIQPGMMSLDRDKLEDVFRQEHDRAAQEKRLTPVYLTKTDGGTPTGAHGQKTGKLHGPSVRVDDEGRMRSLVHYTEGKREGVARCWDEKEPRLYAQYKNGVKDGLLCYYSNDQPMVAQKWKAGKVTDTCLIVEDEGEYKALAEADLDERQQTLLQLCLGEVVQIENQLTEAEKAIKKTCAEWYRTEENTRRKQLAAQKSVEARDRARDRRVEREQQNADALNELIGRGVRSAGW